MRGGAFNNAGGNLSADVIAVWDGYYWDDLGAIPDTAVTAIAVDNSYVYIGGQFTNMPNHYIARWDGITWSPLGTGVDAYVNAIAVGPFNTYVGGHFGGGIARWGINLNRRNYLPLINRQ